MASGLEPSNLPDGFRDDQDAGPHGRDGLAKTLVCLAAVPGLITALVGLALGSTAATATGIILIIVCGFAATLLPDASDHDGDHGL
jgi:hypothetical protein